MSHSAVAQSHTESLISETDQVCVSVCRGRSRGRAQVEDEESMDATEKKTPQKTGVYDPTEAQLCLLTLAVTCFWSKLHSNHQNFI